MSQRLFVYGTLAPDAPNQHVLSRVEGTWVPASVRGCLQEAGWGAEVGYPVIVLDETADRVTGYVFVSEALGEHWDELDAFEGEEYERVTTVVQLRGGATVEAFIYVLRQ